MVVFCYKDDVCYTGNSCLWLHDYILLITYTLMHYALVILITITYYYYWLLVTYHLYFILKILCKITEEGTSSTGIYGLF